MRSEVVQYTVTRMDSAVVLEVVTRNGMAKRITPARSLKVHRHSPCGFEFGYAGSGPAQLALAILLDYTGDPELSEQLHQDFKRDYIAKQGDEHFSIHGRAIDRFIEKESYHENRVA